MKEDGFSGEGVSATPNPSALNRYSDWKVTPWWLRWIGKPAFRRWDHYWQPLPEQLGAWEYSKWPPHEMQRNDFTRPSDSRPSGMTFS